MVDIQVTFATGSKQSLGYKESFTTKTEYLVFSGDGVNRAPRSKFSSAQILDLSLVGIWDGKLTVALVKSVGGFDLITLTQGEIDGILENHILSIFFCALLRTRG